MQAGEKKFQELLYGADQFVIPVFQRDYVWKERDWQRLWEDITALRENDGPAEHFMGSIVSVQMEVQPGETPRYLVIDGQQRLITFAMLLAALRDAAKQANLDLLPEQIQTQYLTQVYQKGLAQYKILPRLRDRQEFFALVEGASRPTAKSRVLAAYDYFAARIEDNGADREISLRELFVAITAKLSFVAVTLQPDQNAFAIFATLNATGQKLEEADLIRNYVFMDVSLEEQDEFDRDHWLPFENSFCALSAEPSVSQTAFYRDFLMRDGAYVRRDEVYLAFQKDSQVKARSRTDLVALLREYAELYLWIERPHTAPTELLRRQLSRFKRIEQSTAYPLVLALLHRYSVGQLDEAALSTCLDIIVSFVLRRAVTGWSTRAYGKIFTAAIAELAGGDPVSTLTCYLARKGWPDDQSFKDALLTYPIYRASPNLTRLLLIAVEKPEAHKEQVDVERQLDDGTLQIEHVLPQTIGNDEAGRWWQDQLGENWQETQRAWLHTIGNLTLTGYNASLSNWDFPRKKETFAESNLNLNKWFEPLVSWSADEIRARGQVVADSIAERWQVASAYEPKAAGMKLDPGEAPARPSQTLAPLRREFWEYLLPVAEQLELPQTLPASTDTWAHVRSPLSIAGAAIVIRTSRGMLAIQFGWNWYNSESLFAWLRLHRQEIEDALQEQVLWVNSPLSNQQSFEVSRFADLADHDSWPGHRDWLVTELKALHQVLGPLVGRYEHGEHVLAPGPQAFLAEMERCNPEVVPTVQRLAEWASREMNLPYYSVNHERQSWMPQLKVHGKWQHFVRLMSDGTIEFRFSQQKKPPFNDPELRAKLLDRVNAIPLVALPPESLGGNPRLPLAMMQDDAAFDALLAVLNWFVDKVQGDGGLAQLVDEQTTDLSLVEVRESLRRAKLEVHYPALGRSFTSTEAAAQASQPVTTALPEAVADPAVKSLPSRHSSYAVNLQDLIAAGLIQPPLALEKMYKGVELRATVEADGRISLAGESYTSLSTAAGMARKSVIGTPDGRSFPQTDGWTFWQYRDAASGELRPIDNLRKQYRQREHA